MSSSSLLNKQIKLIFGIGNMNGHDGPGGSGDPNDPDYSRNRHNLGDWIARRIANENPHPSVSFLFPQGYINDSGIPCLAEMERLGIEDASEVLVIQEDLELIPGKVRVKRKGGAGGHNGIKSIINELGNSNKFGDAGDEFVRLKVGVGHPGRANVSDFVMGDFTEIEMEHLNPSIDFIVDNYQLIVAGNIPQFEADWKEKVGNPHNLVQGNSQRWFREMFGGR